MSNDMLVPISASEAHLVVGIDIVEVSRVAAVWARHGERFRARVFTARELAESDGRVPSLAARFAAKEAAAKALGTGIGAVGWRCIEVRTLPSGQPTLVLHAAAAVRARTLDLHEWQVSLSHSRTLAVACVVGYRGSSGP